jgi:hypothetical protein
VLVVESRTQSDNFPRQFEPLAVNMNTLVLVMSAADYEMSLSIMKHYHYLCLKLGASENNSNSDVYMVSWPSNK